MAMHETDTRLDLTDDAPRGPQPGDHVYAADADDPNAGWCGVVTAVSRDGRSVGVRFPRRDHDWYYPADALRRW